MPTSETDLRSLGLASDLLVMRELSECEHHADRVVMRTPSEPDFWYGNRVIFRTSVVEPEAQIAQFRADFPHARHIVLDWDAPGMEHGAGTKDLERRGFEIDASDVLALSGAFSGRNAPDGIVIRPLEGDADWDRAAALQIETGVEDGYAHAGYEKFTRARCANRRTQISDGQGIWLGAFDGEMLVGDLGLFCDSRVARFQSVETRRSHRGKGICTALLSRAIAWQRQVAPTARPVIVAERDSVAGRIYRRCGFALHETLLSALRKPNDA